MLEKFIQQLEPEIEFEFELSHDGSGKGAALVAAVAKRQSNEYGNHHRD